MKMTTAKRRAAKREHEHKEYVRNTEFGARAVKPCGGAHMISPQALTGKRAMEAQALRTSAGASAMRTRGACTQVSAPGVSRGRCIACQHALTHWSGRKRSDGCDDMAAIVVREPRSYRDMRAAKAYFSELFTTSSIR